MQRERLRRNHRHRSLIRFLLFILLVLIVIGVIIFKAQSPMRQARQQSISIAKKSANIKTINDFYMSNLNHTYYTINGTDQNGHKLYVIIDKNNGQTKNINASQGLTKDSVIKEVKSQDSPKKILNAAPSIFNDQPVWIVSYLNKQNKLCYNTLDFSNGRSIQTIANI